MDNFRRNLKTRPYYLYPRRQKAGPIFGSAFFMRPQCWNRGLCARSVKMADNVYFPYTKTGCVVVI
jgi:hypothetical protein